MLNETGSASSDDDLPLAELINEKGKFSSDDDLPLADIISRRCSATTDESLEFDDSDNDPTFQPGLCEASRCKEDVFAACDRCDALLCHDHFVEDTNSCEHGKKKGRKGIKKRKEGEMVKEVVKAPECCQKPENFIVEGSSKEVPVEKQPKVNKQKIAKRKLASGEEYISPYTKKVMPAKKMRGVCSGIACKTRSLQCDAVTETLRQSIFQEYYSLASLHLQREFILRHVESGDKRRNSSNSTRRQKTNVYYLTVQGNRIKICKKLFLNTLAISDRTVRTALKKLTPSGTVEKERRGGRQSAKVVERDRRIRQEIEEHIQRFPRVESHYCRSSSSKEYLHPDLNLRKMYSMFLEAYQVGDPPSFITYSRIFKKLNLSFHSPKKDQCSLCTTYFEGDETKKTELKEIFEKHVSEKKKVREIKEECKQKASKDETVLSATFDLQQVLYLPISNESALFYKRRLSNYNLTFYNLADTKCHCFVWNESQSKRGSSEISTAVFKSLQYYDSLGKKTAYLFSDGCPGQNKNSIVPTMLLYAVNTLPNLREISLRFFETNHGQSEGDSVHSTISSAMSAAGNVYVPTELKPIFTLARSKKPYIVVPLEFSDFWNFKQLSVDLRVLNIQLDSENIPINWNNMMEFRVLKECPTTIFFRTSHFDSGYRAITLKRQTKQSIENVPLAKLNSEPMKIPLAKYNDLVSLCSGTTPVIRLNEHKSFYLMLPH